jgi:hypothetical protein
MFVKYFEECVFFFLIYLFEKVFGVIKGWEVFSVESKFENWHFLWVHLRKLFGKLFQNVW